MAHSPVQPAAIRKPLRIIFLDGPGDAIASFQHWRAGQDIPSVTHVPFSRQFFDVCQMLNANAWLIGQHPRVQLIEDGNFRIEHRGDPSRGQRGVAFHLSELNQALQIINDISRFRANLVIMGPRPSPLLMSLLRLKGIRFVLVLHCVLWQKFQPLHGLRRLAMQLPVPMYRWGADAILCVSEDIKRQVRQLTHNRCQPFVDFLPHFRPDVFAGIPPPQHATRPFRVMYAGRIEPSKGVFDLLKVAAQLRKHHRNDIIFDICGDGSAFSELKQKVQQEGLADTFRLHGWCDRQQMRACFSRSHVVVVPTTTDFVEGFNMVVVEALLAGRPVISSPVCPALEYLDGAVLTVPPNDIAAYESAIIDVADNPQRYHHFQQRTTRAARRFLNDRTSFKAALYHTLNAIAQGHRVPPREISCAAPETQSLQSSFAAK